MAEAKLYTCPNCGGAGALPLHWLLGTYFIEPWDCALCDGIGQVTLDQILERAASPMEYFQRIVDASKPSDPITDASDIPF